jgi:hypothetical protein
MGYLPEMGLPDHGSKLKLWSISNWIQTLRHTSSSFVVKKPGRNASTVAFGGHACVQVFAVD